MARFLPDYMKGFYFALRLFCQFPLKIFNNRLEKSNLFCFYSVFVAVAYCGVFTFAFLWGDRSKMGIVYASNPIFGFASLSNMMIPLFVVPIVFSKFWNSFFRDLLLVDSLLESYGAEIPYRSQKIFHSCFFTALILIFIIVESFDIIEPAFSNDVLIVRFSQAYNVLTVVLTVTIVSSTCFVRSRFQCLNQQVSILFDNPKISPQILSKQIRAYQRIHCQLCHLCQNLGSYFKFAVLFTMANLCGALLTSLLDAFTRGRLKTATGLLSAAKWHVLDITNLVGLLWPFDLLQSEANETGKVLHEAFLGARDDSNEIQVNTFSLQLIHDRVVFSTGLFNISMKIALPTASVISTYLVIFVQFNTNSLSPWEHNTSNSTAVN